MLSAISSRSIRLRLGPCPASLSTKLTAARSTVDLFFGSVRTILSPLARIHHHSPLLLSCDTAPVARHSTNALTRVGLSRSRTILGGIRSTAVPCFAIAQHSKYHA